MPDLRRLAEEGFGDRCFADPDDHGPGTKILLAEDLERTLAGRGSKREWAPYEIWTSNNAWRWTEGLKKALEERGFRYQAEELELVTWGQEWGGCLAKYSAFMARYLDLNRPADVRADLSPDAGFPIQATFVERVSMDRHVYLFLFRLPDGRPMGQFLDGLRAVWEPPHVARVRIDPARVEAVTTSPNGALKVEESRLTMPDGVVADVGDGCHPAMTSLIGNGIPFGAFRAALARARVESRSEKPGTSYAIGYLNPVTTYRAEALESG
jgi:hypothetical protein